MRRAALRLVLLLSKGLRPRRARSRSSHRRWRTLCKRLPRMSAAAAFRSSCHLLGVAKVTCHLGCGSRDLSPILRPTEARCRCGGCGRVGWWRFGLIERRHIRERGGRRPQPQARRGGGRLFLLCRRVHETSVSLTRPGGLLALIPCAPDESSPSFWRLESVGGKVYEAFFLRSRLLGESSSIGMAGAFRLRCFAGLNGRLGNNSSKDW